MTTDQLPGYEIRQILGEVVSSMARTRNPYREGVKNLRGGAYDPMAPDNLTRWRTDSVARLGEEARRLGANAVIGMRFDSRDCGEMWMEICAYGTAVIVVPKMPEVMPPDQPIVAADDRTRPGDRLRPRRHRRTGQRPQPLHRRRNPHPRLTSDPPSSAFTALIKEFASS